MELKELALRIRRGDREALKTLISEYGVGVYQKAYQKTQDKVLAREATRQTFAQLVTSLQEQTDMDGWELWLNALAKRNIETYSNIGSDMAFLENQLNAELFKPNTLPAQDAARQFAMQQQQEAQQAQLHARQQYEARQAQLLMQQQYEAQQAQLLMQQQFEAQQRLQQYEAQLKAQQQSAAQQAAPLPDKQQLPADERQAAAQPKNPQSAHIARTAPDLPERTAENPARHTKRRRERLFEEPNPTKAKSPWPVIVLLVVLCIALVWLVIGVAMSLNWLPKLDLGYAWFNEHILELF